MRATLSSRSAALLLCLGLATPLFTACTDAIAPAVSAAPEPEALTFAAAPSPEQTPAPKPAARGAAPQPVTARARTTTPALPDVSYVCPMVQDADVLEDKAGKCPKCGMELTPVRIVEAYSCITHNAIVQKAGSCPIDKRALVPIVASLYFACADSPDKHEISPGTCADGKPRLRKVERRAHGDHNPRHGGMLFMASDKWHHLEGTYPSTGLFRVFFYDDFTRPMAPKGFAARAVFKDASDKEIGSIALKPGRISNTMEATLPGKQLPIALQLRVKFTPKDQESGFDFAFTQYTKEPVAAPRTPVMTSNQTPATAPRPAAASAPAQAGTQTIAPTTDGQTVTVGGTLELGAGPMPARVLPTDTKELLTLLTNDSNEVKTLLDQGMFTAVWKPAIDAKEDALALGDHAKEFPEAKRVALDSAVRRLMLAAWQLDSFGDLGDKQKLMRAYNQFAQAVEEVKAIYATR